jgi:hypothetical protein
MSVPPDVRLPVLAAGEIANSAFAPRKIITREAVKRMARPHEFHVATLTPAALLRLTVAQNPSWYLTFVSANFYMWLK